MRSVLWIALGYITIRNIQARYNPPVIHYVNWLPTPRRAMTIPPFGIYIKKEYADNEVLLKHELCHWSQYRNRGLFTFYLDYLTQFGFVGYDKMPMEVNCGPKV